MDLFSRFRSKQCYDLCRLYNRHHARLDAFESPRSEHLDRSKTALRNEIFTEIDVEKASNKLPVYPFKKSTLPDRLVDARRLQHSRFDSLNLVYGHKAYLDKLMDAKLIALLAIAKLERRTAGLSCAQ